MFNFAGVTIVHKEKMITSPVKKKPKLITDSLMSDKQARHGSGNRFFCMCCKLHFSAMDKYREHLRSSTHKAKASANGEAVVEDTTPQSTTPVPSPPDGEKIFG